MSQATTTADRSGGLSAVLSWVLGRSVLDRLPDAAAWIVGILLLAPRIYLAIPFFNAGQARITNWGSQSFLFQYEHPLPLLDPMQAAYLTTTFELLLPVLLVLGLFGRLAALGLACMAATIYFVIGGAYAIPSEQVPWMAVGLLLFVTGPGRVSLDYLIRRTLLRD